VPAPDFIRLQEPERRLEHELPSQIAEMGVQAERRKDSGVLQIRILEWREEMYGPLLALVSSEDDHRLYYPAAGPNLPVVHSELESSILTEQIPVLGPGGRVTVYYAQPGVHVDVVVRQQVDRQPGKWRDTEDMLARIREELRGVGRACDILAGFGYFELSKYEPQSWLRPTFVFSIDLKPGNRSFPSSRFTIVEPATEGGGIGLEEGLGSWTE
jgi:hypothetical protein